MPKDEQGKKMLEDFKEFRQSGVSSGAKAIHKAFQDDNFVNPLLEMSTPEMRLYSIGGNYFESIDELLIYCKSNKISTEELNILDYYRSFAGRFDVIRKSNSYTSMLYTAYCS